MLKLEHISFQTNENHQHTLSKSLHIFPHLREITVLFNIKKLTGYELGGTEEQKENKNDLFCQSSFHLLCLII